MAQAKKHSSKARARVRDMSPRKDAKGGSKIKVTQRHGHKRHSDF